MATENEILFSIFNSGDNNLIQSVLRRNDILEDFLKEFQFENEFTEKQFINTLIFRGKLTINQILIALFHAERFDLMEWVLINPTSFVQKAQWEVSQEVIDEFAKNSLRHPVNFYSYLNSNPRFMVYLSNYLSNCHLRTRVNKPPIVKTTIYYPTIDDVLFWIDTCKVYGDFKIKIDHCDGHSLVEAMLKLPFDLFKQSYVKLTLRLNQKEKQEIRSIFRKKLFILSDILDFKNKKNFFEN